MIEHNIEDSMEMAKIQGQGLQPVSLFPLRTLIYLAGALCDARKRKAKQVKRMKQERYRQTMLPIPLLKYHSDAQKIVLHDIFRAVFAVVHSADLRVCEKPSACAVAPAVRKAESLFCSVSSFSTR